MSKKDKKHKKKHADDESKKKDKVEVRLGPGISTQLCLNRPKGKSPLTKKPM